MYDVKALALLPALLLAFSSSAMTVRVAAAALPAVQLAPVLAPIGVAEVIWDKAKDACPQTKKDPVTGAPKLCESPDSVPIAWHNPLLNRTFLISSTDCTFPGVGDNLGDVKGQHTCGSSPYVAARDPRPWSYNNHQWLQSARVFPNGSGFALVHNEFHGEQPPHNKSWCSFQDKTSTAQCILWSTDTATTKDGGSTWQLAHAPVIALPRPYIKDTPKAGYGVLGQVQYHKGYYYSHVSRSFEANTGAGPAGTTGKGTCVFRTSDPSNPASFRGWNGTSWSTAWVDPYEVATPANELWRRTCQSISLSGTSASHLHVKKFAGALAKIPGWPSHVMSGLGPGVGGALYFFPSRAGSLDGPAPFSAWEPNAHVGHSKVDVEAWVDSCAIKGASGMMYPNLLDHDSPFGLTQSDGSDEEAQSGGLSYGLVGNTSLHLYWVVSRQYIMRIPVAWFLPGQVPPRGPFQPRTNPPPLNSANCSALKVVGATMPQVNGIYHVEDSKLAKDGTRGYKKDTNHSIYHFKKTWILGRPGRGGVKYFSAPLDVSGQGAGVPDTWGPCYQIRVSCMDE